MTKLYKFKDESLLNHALTHPSVNKNDKSKSYERLEFLGDKIIGLIIANELWKKYPEASEADLSVMHGNLANTETMSKICKKIGLDKLIILDKGEELRGGRSNQNILEDAMEAYIAAIYLDSDFSNASNYVSTYWGEFVDNCSVIRERDAKSILQETAQKMGKDIPVYKVINTEGSAHSPIFTIEVIVNGFDPVTSIGNNKKDAQQAAAKLMLQKISENVVE